MSRSHVPADARLLALRFAERLELRSTLAALAASGVLVACGGSVTVVEDDGGGGQTPTAPVPTPIPNGGAGGTGPTGGTGSMGGSGPEPYECDLPPLGPEQHVELVCFDVDAVCPAADSQVAFEVISDQLNWDACSELCCDGAYVVEVACGPDPSVESGCCYEAVVETYSVCMGRPLMSEGQAQTAPIARTKGWLATRPQPGSRATFDDVTRLALASAWTHDARYEHASVASFAQFAMDLLSVGAPAELVRDASAAMADEVDHAERCFALASRFAEQPIGPGPLDASGPTGLNGATLQDKRIELFRATLCEGAIGETVATLMAAEARESCRDAEVYRTLDRIATDEARHAELAWRTLSWLLRSASTEERELMRSVANDVLDQAPGIAVPELDVNADSQGLRNGGRLDETKTRALVEIALRDIIKPCLAGLLAS